MATPQTKRPAPNGQAQAGNNNHAAKSIQLTQQGFDELKEELKELVEVKQPQVVERISVARSHGDLSENAEYSNAKEELQLVEARIEEIEEILKVATVVKQTTSHTKVGMGSKVILQPKGKSKQVTYHIVGEFEAEPGEGKISIDSPLGKAVVNKKKGDEAVVSAPAGEVRYVIKEIK